MAITTFEQDIEIAKGYHGHLCAGMVLGIRMARYALGQMGIEDPRSDRDLIVYVELSRCPADAVYAVTGITVGRRRLKLADMGKFAMTFVDTRENRAVRAIPRDEVPHMPHGEDPIAFFASYSDEELFEVRPVTVEIPLEEMPGSPTRHSVCDSCKEEVLDGREVERDGRTLCQSCAGIVNYYQFAD